ncbi:hypothetical protein [Thermodesulfovibrio yellowstonii]|uniref:hypothetical protein n=1 Tax=Thermodesulfovibrio yellowstonii TaxID=28262 RepID=UPI0004293C0A|nr:hypothetical protein [Thermodesulfovibrio islandicus]
MKNKETLEKLQDEVVEPDEDELWARYMEEHRRQERELKRQIERENKKKFRKIK